MVKKITKDVTIKDNGIIVCLFYFYFMKYYVMYQFLK